MQNCRQQVCRFKCGEDKTIRRIQAPLCCCPTSNRLMIMQSLGAILDDTFASRKIIKAKSRIFLFLRPRCPVVHNVQSTPIYPLQQRAWNEWFQFLVKAKRCQSCGKHKAFDDGDWISHQVKRCQACRKLYPFDAGYLIVAQVKRCQSCRKFNALDAADSIVAQVKLAQRSWKFEVLKAVDFIVPQVKKCDSNVSFLVDDRLNTTGF